MNNKKTKKVTIADLAKMIKEDVVDRMATKEDLNNLEERMNGKFEGVNKRIDDISLNRVKYEDFNKLTIRVEKLEKVK